MNNNIFHQKVKLPFDIKHSPLKIPSNNRASSIDYYEVVDQRLLDLIDECGAYAVHTEYFSFPSRGFICIHLDDGIFYNRSKLNMFIGTGSMSWFDPLPEHRNKEILFSEINSPYMFFPREEVELVHQNQMYGDYLINPGIPHNFVNNSAHECWVVSLTLFDKNTQTFLSFEEAVKRFNAYLLD